MSFLDKAKDMAADAVDKVKDLVDGDQNDGTTEGTDLLHSEKAEQVSDAALGKANELAASKLDPEKAKMVTDATAKLDTKIGTE